MLDINRGRILVTLFVFSVSLCLSGSISSSAHAGETKKRVLLLWQKPDGHPKNTHEYELGQKILKRELDKFKSLDVVLVNADEPWKDGPDVLAKADGVVLFISEGARWLNADAKRLVAGKDHPIQNGLSKMKVREEFYYTLKFPKDGITPILQASIDGENQTVAWAFSRSDGGRSFGFSGLHFHENWQLPEYRRLVTQGVLWTLDVAIPKEGIAVK
jgi:hypothetical protein